MASQQINIALIKAAETILKRSLSQSEQTAIISKYDSSYGTHYDKSLAAISSVTHLSQFQINEARKASDNADRVVNDLLDLLNS